MQPWRTFFPIGTSLLFHVQFSLLLPDLHIGFSRGRSGGLVFLSLSEFSTVYWDPHSQRLWHSQESRNVFLELSSFFDDPADVGNLISGSSAFAKTSLNIREFTVHVLLKPGLENFEHYFTSMWDDSVMSNSAIPWTVAQPGFFVHRILQARILEKVAISFSRGSSPPRD